MIRDAQKTKQASVTTLISLSNEYFALSVGETKTGYSNKFTSEEKKQLKETLSSAQWTLPQIALPHVSWDSKAQLPIGLVVRTQAAKLTDAQELYRHFVALLDSFTELYQVALHRTCFSCLKTALPPWQTALDQLASPREYEEILTDDIQLFQQMQDSTAVPSDKKLRLYDEQQAAQLPLSKLYGLASKLETALGRRVWLKSGGYLVIDPTEALTVIDVNSGKYEAKKGIEETAYHINMEASEEIALQLRLRNLNGIIIVDFINMKNKAHQDALLNHLKSLTSYDKQKTTIIDMTPLGLVEITRKKGFKTLAEQLESGD